MGTMSRGPWSMTMILIAINVGVYLLDWMLVSAGASIQMAGTTRVLLPNGDLAYQSVSQAPIFALGHFSTYTAFSKLEFWRFVTFQFLHGSPTHLLFNMIGLYFFGPAVEGYLRSRKRFLAFYLTCGIFGGFLYLVLNLIANLTNAGIPGLLFVPPTTPLVGASAGVFGILMASAFISKDAVMYVFMVIPMKVRTGAYLFVALAAFNLFIKQGANMGGDAAHLGGAAAGYFFIRRHHMLHDFFDIFGTSKKGSGSRQGRSRKKAKPTVDEATLDRILDKVREEGMHSLTEKEQKLLRKASEQKKR
ncbi:MAG: rhomboid family intramembrane serine protease [Phycisphaerales bacterium JB050]